MTLPLGLATRRLAIVVAGAGAEDLLNQVLEPRGFAPVLVVKTVAELTAQMRSRQPALVVLPLPTSGASGELALFESELRRHPQTAAIGTAPQKDADTVLTAMRAGITEFILSPITEAEFTAAVSRVLSNIAGPQRAGRIFAVYSAKGGVGTSTIAASLAWALAHLPGAPQVALADFNTACAGLRVMLNLNPMYDMGSVAMHAERLDRDYLRSVMLQHPDGLSALIAAEELDAVEPLGVGAATALLELLRREFSDTVVDTDHHFNDQTLAALDSADRVLVITQFDVSALRSTQRTLGVFARLGYPAEKIVIVANRRTDRDRISMAGAERVLGRDIAYTLPNDYATCSGAITQGAFVQRYAPSSPLVGAFTAMAAALTGTTVAATNGKGHERSRLARMFSRKTT